MRVGLPLFIDEGHCEGGWSPCSLLAAANGGPPAGGGEWVARDFLWRERTVLRC
jgi:hypothetical protein